jgi:hypothetical protein
MSDNAEGAIKNICLQFTETGNTGYTRPRKTKQKHNTICVGHHYRYMQTGTSNVNKTWTLLKITVGKDEPSIVFIRTLSVKTHNKTTQKIERWATRVRFPPRQPGWNQVLEKGKQFPYVTYMASVICKVCAMYESYYRKQIILDALGACLQ